MPDEMKNSAVALEVAETENPPSATKALRKIERL
jgi:hypothetical protein